MATDAAGQRRSAGASGGGMYPVFYWAGVVTLAAWTAFSAYSAIAGF